jgi:hypothetical protein
MSEEKTNGEPRLHVDEDWKKSVAEERARLREEEQHRAAQTRQEAPGERRLPEPSIQIFMAGLYTQTLVALGQMPNPLTGNTERNDQEAQYLIDTIAMLSDKMEGKLTPDESAYIRNILYDLRMRYVSPPQQPEPADEPAGGEPR